MMQREDQDAGERLVLVPDAMPSKAPDRTPRIRLMWGQHLLEDLLAGRYRSLVCAVNAEDNSHGIISQLATLLPTSQWDRNSVTEHGTRAFPIVHLRRGYHGRPAHFRPAHSSVSSPTTSASITHH